MFNFITKRFFLCVGLLITLQLCNGILVAQSGVTVTGRVTDKNNKPLENVSVTEVDADKRIIKGVNTNVDGNFSISISNVNNTLSFSVIGHQPVENMKIGAKRVFNVSLEQGSKDIDEVVVVGRRRVDNGMLPIAERNMTTAAVRINAKDMEEMQATSIDQALQGRMSGVDIAANSGDPGAGMQIRIRGTSSINSSTEPLIVVDGMPFETQIPNDFNFGTADDQGYAALLNIAPSDIKDITILKDAAATAIWGSRAANGVLIINTKRGTRGKPSIGYNFRGSVSLKAIPIPMLTGDEYSTLIPEAYMNRNGVPLNSQSVNEFKFDPNDPYWYNNYSNNTSWIDAINRNGLVQDHNVSITGGGEKARYFASFGFLNNKGITVGTDLNRITSRINLDYNISERIKIRTDVAFAHSSNNRNYTDQVRKIAYIKMPNMSIYEYDEYGNLTPNYFSPMQNIQGQVTGLDSRGNPNGTYNPVAMSSVASNNILTERVTPKFNIQYSIIPRVLNATVDVQFDINNTKSKTFLPQVATGRPWTEAIVNLAYDGDNDGFNVQTKSMLVYTPEIKNPKHTFSGLLNWMTYDNKSIAFQSRVSNTASSGLTDPSNPGRANGSLSNLSARTVQTRTIGATLNAQYGYDDRYIVSIGLRGDATSRLAQTNRFGVFPSFSGRWRASAEKFMSGLQKYVDDLSFRVSYGQVGNAPGSDYTFYNTYSTFGWDYLGQSAIYPSSMQLNNLRWETVHGYNFGANLSMFKNRIGVDFEVYRNRTRDLFFKDLQIGSINGFNSVNMNVGTMDNQGWEIAIQTTPYKSKLWTVDVSFNISRNVNMIREISEYYPIERGNVTTNGTYLTYMQVNNPFGSFYGYKYKGVYTDRESTIARDSKGNPIIGPNGQIVYMRFNYPGTDYIFQPGDAMYEDLNNDGNINHMDIVYLGNSNPMFTGGFGINLSYKNTWSFRTFFNFRYDYDIINGTEMNSTNMYGYDNQSTAVLRRWKQEGDVTDIPRALYQTGYNWLGSDRYVEDGSFLRFRTATLRYNVPKKTTDKWKMKSLSAYVTVENIVTFTNYRGQDPEVSVRGSDPFRVATDNSLTPPVRMITLGLMTAF